MGVRLHVTSFHTMLTSYLRVDDVTSEITHRVPNSKNYKFSPLCYPLFFFELPFIVSNWKPPLNKTIKFLKVLLLFSVTK